MKMYKQINYYHKIFLFHQRISGSISRREIESRALTKLAICISMENTVVASSILNRNSSDNI